MHVYTLNTCKQHATTSEVPHHKKKSELNYTKIAKLKIEVSKLCLPLLTQTLLLRDEATQTLKLNNHNTRTTQSLE